MITPEELMTKFAKKHSYNTWDELMYDCSSHSRIEYTKRVMSIYARVQREANIRVDIFRLLDKLQDKYSLNDFCPADIHLWKNGDVLFATVKDDDGIIFLERWILEEFKNSKVY